MGSPVDELSLSNFAKAWRNFSEADTRNACLALARTNVTPLFRAPGVILTREDRNTLMLREARTVASLCAGTETYTNEFRAAMRALLDKIAGVNASDVNAHLTANPQTKRARHAAQAGVGETEMQHRNPVPVSSQPGRKRTTRYPNQGQMPNNVRRSK